MPLGMLAKKKKYCSAIRFQPLPGYWFMKLRSIKTVFTYFIIILASLVSSCYVLKMFVISKYKYSITCLMTLSF